MWLAIISIFVGESFSIYGELRAGKDHFIEGVLWGLVGWPLLIFGYWNGIKTATVWQVTVASIVSILIMEPLLIVIMFREYPTRNVLIGCLLGVTGLIIANIKE